jgi:peptide-methionine (S)-S-oxide reductase
MNTQTITLAGGCFWCLEAVYELVDGVHRGGVGLRQRPCARAQLRAGVRGDTGHAEVVKLSFDADRITLAEVLEIFFTIHDPTTLNRQGNDVGTQYRSGIYWTDPAHEATVRQVHAQADAALGGRVVTELQPLDNYWPAEAYHQHYFANHPNQGYCAYVVAPKVDKFRKTFRQRVKA